MPRTTPRAINVKMKRSASTTVPARSAGRMRCSTWSKKSVAYISDSVRRVTAFLASSSSMSRPTRFERRSPLVCTAKPSDSSHSCRRAICVERPEPSIPSTTTSVPVNSSGRTPTSDSPKKYWLGSTEAAAGRPLFFGAASCGAASCSVRRLRGVMDRCKPFQIDPRGNDLSHLFLELIDRHGSIEDDEIVRFGHLVVLVQDHPLKNAETFRAVVRQTQIHSGLIVFQLRPAAQNTIHSNIQRRAKIKREVRHRSEPIEVAQPARGATARGVASEGRVNVAVRKNEIIPLKQRQDLALAAIREIGRVQQGECNRSEQAALLAAPRGRFHQRRGVPFREVQPVTADLEPSLQQVQLRALSRTIGTLDHDESTGVRASGQRFRCLLRLRLCRRRFRHLDNFLS